MTRLLALLAAIVVSSPATADCPPPFEGWIQLHGEVAACRQVRAPRPSREPFLRLRLDSPAASVQDCEGRECLGLAHYESYAESLEDRELFFVRAREGVSCSSIQQTRRLAARVTYQCCDTIPHRGVCALGGPVIELVADEL